MRPRSASAAGDLALAAAALAAGVADIALREVYHRVSAEAVSLLVLLALSAACALLALLVLLRPRAVPQALGRPLLVAAAGVALIGSIGTAPATLWARGPVAQALVIAGLGMVALVAVVGHRLAAAGWQRLRLALLLGLVLFLGSPLALGLLGSRDRVWPGPADPAPQERSLTLVLLLDELNSTQAPPLVAELERAGLKVRSIAVPSVGGSTGDVVPSLFAGEVFRKARPCTPTASCDGQHVLDFARIRAGRPDIDVVGFFQPYCSMTGLRSCFRATIPLAFMDTGRVRCGLWRRFDLDLGVDGPRCREIYARSWGDMTDATVRAVRAAPALHSGGMLFAHLALPHPPGEHAAGTLQDHYRGNMGRASALLRDLLGKAAAAGLPTRVLIFSDHPLRQAQWCRSFAPYAWDGCRPDPSLEDRNVPVIVAGQDPPDLSALRDNLEVFGLVAKLR